MLEVTCESQPQDFQELVSIGKHKLLLDASVEDGGQDTGITPHDLLTASLVSCKTMTMRMYAKRKGWDLTGLKITGKQIPVDRTLTRFEIQITLPAHLGAGEKERLLDISKKCPVHRAISNQVEIQTLVTSKAD